MLVSERSPFRRSQWQKPPQTGIFLVELSAKRLHRLKEFSFHLHPTPAGGSFSLIHVPITNATNNLVSNTKAAEMQTCAHHHHRPTQDEVSTASAHVEAETERLQGRQLGASRIAKCLTLQTNRRESPRSRRDGVQTAQPWQRTTKRPSITTECPNCRRLRTTGGCRLGVKFPGCANERRRAETRPNILNSFTLHWWGDALHGRSTEAACEGRGE